VGSTIEGDLAVSDENLAPGSNSVLPSWWEVVAFLLGVVSFLALVVSLFVEFPGWLVLFLCICLVAGGLISARLAFVQAKLEGRSLRRTLWRTVTEPVRFIFRWTF